MEAQTLVRLREVYGLSVVQMSMICGFGINVWRDYENGKPPNKSNGKLLSLIINPISFKKLLLEVPDEKKNIMGSKYKNAVAVAEGFCSEIDQLTEDMRRQIGNRFIDAKIKGHDRFNVQMRPC